MRQSLIQPGDRPQKNKKKDKIGGKDYSQANPFVKDPVLILYKTQAKTKHI